MNPLRALLGHGRWTLRDLRRLEALGVPGAALMALRADFGIAVGQVSLSRDGEHWEPEGPDARLLLAVPGEDGSVIDIAAVSTAQPDQWALLTGEGNMLGRAALDDAPRRAAVRGYARLRLFGTPIDWLRSGCDGVCVLDWRAALAEIRSLGERVELRCDPGASHRLKALLAHGNLPQVRETGRIEGIAA